MAACSNSAKIQFDKEKYEYNLPEDVQRFCIENNENCPEIDIFIARVSPLWIEQALNAHIFDVKNNEQLKTEYDKVLDMFAYEQVKDYKNKKEGATFKYSMNYDIEYLGTEEGFAQFKVNKNIYAGGAHGMSAEDYYLFDLNKEKEVKFDDLVKDKEQLKQRLEKRYHQYLEKELDLLTADQIKVYESSWPFFVSNNVYFSDDKVHFVYQPYELGSFAQGFIRLSLPINAVKDILDIQK